MAWQELSIAVPHEYVEPISYLFSRYGRGLSMEPDGPDRIMLRTYLPDNSRQRLARIDVGVRLVSAVGPLGELVIRQVNDEDWQNAWKSHFTLLKIGPRLVIKPSWIDYQPTGQEVVVEIDPGMAFGTGYHPTTHTCLEAIDQLVVDGASVLDLGTGSGILSIAAIRLGAGNAVAMDIDSQAVRAARQNFRRTGTNPKGNPGTGQPAPCCGCLGPIRLGLGQYLRQGYMRPRALHCGCPEGDRDPGCLGNDARPVPAGAGCFGPTGLFSGSRVASGRMDYSRLPVPGLIPGMFGSPRPPPHPQRQEPSRQLPPPFTRPAPLIKAGLQIPPA